MQFRGLALLGLLLGAEGTQVVRRQTSDDDVANLVRRQDVSSVVDDVSSAVDSVVAGATSIASDDDDDDTPSSTAVAVITATSTSADDTSATSATSESVPADVSTTSDASSSDSDSTVTKTVTVTDSDADTITQKKTVQRTVTSTVLVTSTFFKTETVTSDGKTATKTVYETSTTWANEKRAVDLAPRTIGYNGLAVVDAETTAAPELPDDFLIRRNPLDKRAIITKLVTVTVGDSDDKTVVDTVTQTVISTVSKGTKLTKTVTETEAAGASTTVTITSTLVITSTKVTTGVVKTATVAPTGSYGTAGAGGTAASDSSSSSSDGGSSGLSTGAKAGIGAGCGVVGLAAIGIILWCCLKKRNKPSKSEIDDMFGSSEVPVGGPVRGSGTSPHMTQNSAGVDAALAPGRMPTKGSHAEGYRGTAIGDGRTGYAKPQTFGSTYNSTVSPETQYSRTATMNSAGRNDASDMYSPVTTAAELGNDGGAARWIKSDAAEIDGTQMTSAQGSSPAEHVYEMPAQPYR